MKKITKKELINVLLGASKYPTMNSWNGVYSLSRNIKLYNLGLNEKQEELAYSIICREVETNIIGDILDDYSQKLLEKTNHRYTLGINGRCGGYVVMYKVVDYESPYKYKIACGEGFLSGYTEEGDFDDWSYTELNDAYKILKIFNSIVDDMIEDFKYMLDNACVEEEEEVITNKVKRLYV